MPVDPSYLHLVYPGPMPAYLYGRVSKDPTKKGSSVDDQIDEAKHLCAQFSWPVVGVFRDVDESASRHRKGGERQGFEEMLEGIRRRECRIVVAFEASRYYRNLETYVRLRAACIEAEVLLCYDGQVYDLTKRSDRKATARDALDAEDEADGIHDRNMRTARRGIAEGHPNGTVLYGYRRRYDPNTGDLIDQVPHEEKAHVVREVFERVASGESQYAIAVDLNARGVASPSPRGKQWTGYHMRLMLRNASYIGMRVHRGAPVTKGKWEALISDDLWEQVQNVLASPLRTSTPRREVAHWLSGLARCGPCDEKGSRSLLRVMSPRVRAGKQYFSYQCHGDGGMRSQFCVTIKEDRLDAYVEEALLSWLSSPALARAFEPEADGAAAAAAARVSMLRRQLGEAREMAATIGPDGMPGLSVASLAALEASLTPQIAAAEAEARPSRMPAALGAFQGVEDVEAVWEGLDITQRRAVVRMAVTVRLWPARAPGVKRIEPGRVTLAFVGQPGFVPLLRGRDGRPGASVVAG